MRAIPENMKREILANPFYKVCCLKDEDCKGRIEWHHNFIYAGRQVNEIWAILPLCVFHHGLEKWKQIGDKLDFIMMTRMTEQDEEKYPRFNWRQLQRYLESKNRP